MYTSARFFSPGHINRDMQTDAERTLNNLHVLGALSHNDKLMTNDDTFDIYAPTSLRGVFRMWHGERRVTNIGRIRQCVRSAITFSCKSLEDTTALMNSSPSSPTQSEQMKLRVDTHAMQHLRMLDGLNRAKGGLHNLLQTYREDAASASQVQLLMEEIEDFIRVMQPHTSKLRQSCPPSPPYMPLHGSLQCVISAS
jgi:hypothetical protein